MKRVKIAIALLTAIIVFVPTQDVFAYAFKRNVLRNGQFEFSPENFGGSITYWNCYRVYDFGQGPCYNKERKPRGLSALKKGVRISHDEATMNLVQSVSLPTNVERAELTFEYRFTNEYTGGDKLANTSDAFSVYMLNQGDSILKTDPVFKKKTPHQQDTWKSVTIPMNKHIGKSVYILISVKNDGKNTASISLRNAEVNAMTKPFIRSVAMLNNGKALSNADVFLYSAKGKRITKTTTDKYGRFFPNRFNGSDETRRLVIKKAGKRYTWDIKTPWGSERGFVFVGNKNNPANSTFTRDDRALVHGVHRRIGSSNTVLLKSYRDGTEDPGRWYTYNMKTRKRPKKLPFSDEIRYASGNTVVSPNGKFMAVAFDKSELYRTPITETRLEMWNVRKAKRVATFTIQPNEFFGEFQGVFYGSGGYNLTWKDNTCLVSSIFEEPEKSGPSDTQKDFVRKQTFCR